MGGLQIEVDPAEVGLDQARLDRIDRHFARYVDEQKLAGWLITVARHGKLAHVSTYGQRDIEAGLPVEPDTLWRIYSMTKPITSVAAMMLYEEGGFELTDPVYKYIPSFRDVRVFAGGSDISYTTVPATEPIRIWHLLSHTSGLTYGFMRNHPVDAIYRARGFEWGSPRGADLAAICDDCSPSMPLLFQPGSEWSYSVATDVLGRRGRGRLRSAAGRVLRRADLRAARHDRLGVLCRPGGPAPAGRPVHAQPGGRQRRRGWTQWARRRCASRRTSAAAAAWCPPRRLQPVHPDAAAPAGQPGGRAGRRPAAQPAHRGLHGEQPPARRRRPGDLRPAAVRRDGVRRASASAWASPSQLDPVATKTLGSAGEFNWGGAASTTFWVDPAEQLTVSFFTQLHALERLPDQAAVAAAGLPGSG